jgi:hypothetical protein
MAVRAVRRGKRRAGLGMHRIIGLLPGGEVASGISAIGRSDLQVVVAVDMALLAGDVGMAVGQEEAGGAVIEFRAEPTVKTMADVALGREVGGNVIGIRSLLVILQVAGSALRGQAEIDTGRRALVAGGTFHGGVRAKQRETILVILYLLRGDVPALHGMALGAVGSKLAAVNVGVAVGAILADICENGLHVALRALNFFVHAAEGVLCPAMIKFSDGSNGPPTGGGMTVFAGNGQWAMGIARGLNLGSRHCPA